MDTGGKMFVGHLRAFSPRIMMIMMILLRLVIIASSWSSCSVEAYTSPGRSSTSSSPAGWTMGTRPTLRQSSSSLRSLLPTRPMNSDYLYSLWLAHLVFPLEVNYTIQIFMLHRLETKYVEQNSSNMSWNLKRNLEIRANTFFLNGSNNK